MKISRSQSGPRDIASPGDPKKVFLPVVPNKNDPKIFLKLLIYPSRTNLESIVFIEMVDFLPFSDSVSHMEPVFLVADTIGCSDADFAAKDM